MAEKSQQQQQRHDRPSDRWSMFWRPASGAASQGAGATGSGRDNELSSTRDVEYVREAIHRTYK